MKKLILLTLPLAVIFGCDSNPTNEPSAEDINKAVERKMKAIDDDPSMTAEQKAEMKKHISGPANTGPTSR
ncbi:MAG TPA: hypothetical protein VK171_07220 [Fimbriimonas sp.]|nr:hypothetical protein [Fimbriimonas sp.]